jgi:hypothetical protein
MALDFPNENERDYALALLATVASNSNKEKVLKTLNLIIDPNLKERVKSKNEALTDETF